MGFSVLAIEKNCNYGPAWLIKLNRRFNVFMSRSWTVGSCYPLAGPLLAKWVPLAGLYVVPPPSNIMEVEKNNNNKNYYMG